MSVIYFLGLEDQAGLDNLLAIRQENERRQALTFDDYQLPAFYENTMPDIRRVDKCGHIFEAVKVNNDTFVLTVGGNAYGAK
jgi:hypothetical protein